jgi:hypothetical protein
MAKGEYKIGKGKPPITGRFKPGQSGNPAGKKPGTLSLKRMLREYLQRSAQGEQTYADLYIKRLIDKAIAKGDANVMKLIWEAIEGKPVQPLVTEDGDGKRLPITGMRVESEKVNGRPRKSPR